MSSEPRDGTEFPVEVRGITYRYGSRTVLRDVSIRARRGRTLCIIGGSGVGKSTLLRIMFGAARPNEGQVFIEGEDITKLKGRPLDLARRRFGVMFQNGALLNSLTLAENVALPIRHHTKLDEDTIRTVVKMKLELVGLRDSGDRLPSELSGGMQKRGAVARALALDPRILFYDEPSAGLDPILTARLDDIVNDLKNGMEITSIVVTHEMDSVRRIADDIVMLGQHGVLFEGTLEGLERVEDEEVRAFLSGRIDRRGSDEDEANQAYIRDLLG